MARCFLKRMKGCLFFLQYKETGILKVKFHYLHLCISSLTSQGLLYQHLNLCAGGWGSVSIFDVMYAVVYYEWHFARRKWTLSLFWATRVQFANRAVILVSSNVPNSPDISELWHKVSEINSVGGLGGAAYVFGFCFFLALDCSGRTGELWRQITDRKLLKHR